VLVSLLASVVFAFVIVFWMMAGFPGTRP